MSDKPVEITREGGLSWKFYFDIMAFTTHFKDDQIWSFDLKNVAGSWKYRANDPTNPETYGNYWKNIDPCMQGPIQTAYERWVMQKVME